MKTVMSLRLDVDVKEAAQEVAKSVGLTLSALVNSYLRQVSVTRRIELYAPEPMTSHMESLIGNIEAEIAAGNVSKSFNSAEAFIAELEK